MADEIYEEEQEQVCVIPQNFSSGNKVFRGMIELRNLIEAAVICLPVWYLEKELLSGTAIETQFVVMVATIGPLALFSIIGINGDCISQFIVSVFRFMKNKRVMRYQRIKKYSDTNKSVIKTAPKNKK